MYNPISKKIMKEHQELVMEYILIWGGRSTNEIREAASTGELDVPVASISYPLLKSNSFLSNPK